MAYKSRDIKDRVAQGDDIFLMREHDTDKVLGKIILTPMPTDITEIGTDINKALLQPIEDRLVFLMNRFIDDITSNPFSFTLDTLDGITAEGVWENGRIGC